MKPLYLFYPYAGGGPACYQELVNCLDAEDVAVILTRATRGRMDQPIDSFDGAVLHALDGTRRALGRVERGRRVIFFGHSLGALIAAEVLDLLRPTAALANHGVDVWLSGAPGPTYVARANEPSVKSLSDESFIRKIQAGAAGPRHMTASAVLRTFLPFLRAEYAIAESRRARRLAISPALNVVVGLADSVVPREGWVHWRSVAETVCYLPVPGAGHDLPTTHASDLARLMLQAREQY